MLDFGHSHSCVVVPPCYNSQFHNDIQCGTTLNMFTCHLYSFFGELSNQIFCPFIKLVCLLSYCWILRIFHRYQVTVLYHICFLLIFSPSLWLIFPFSSQCLLQAEVFNSNAVFLIHYFFHGLYLGLLSKKSSPFAMSCKFSPVLSTRSFIVSHFIFLAMVHFEFIFIKRCNVCV